jgi:hypothetical protein
MLSLIILTIANFLSSRENKLVFDENKIDKEKHYLNFSVKNQNNIPLF